MAKLTLRIKWFNQILRDIQQRWLYAVPVIFLDGILVCLCILNFNYLNALIEWAPPSACLPDGSFRADSNDYNYWAESGFFQINLGFGKFTFTQAKVLDVSWDVVIGRGGQALLTFISWRIFALYVTTSMDVAPTTFSTYRNIFLEKQATVLGTYRILRDFTFRLGLHSRAAMSFMVGTMIFVLVFPTFTSSMTAYSGNVQPVVADKDGNFISYPNFVPVQYIIHDGWRVNRSTDYVVACTTTGERERDKTDPILSQWPSHYCTINDEAKETLEATFQYVRQYGLYGKRTTNSTFQGWGGLDSPVLNISASYEPDAQWIPDLTPTEIASLAGPSNAKWLWDGQVYNYDWMKSKGTCQTVETYKWGFSYVQLNLMVILLTIWTTGINTMWLMSQRTLKQRGKINVAGEHIAVLELAEAMRAQVKITEDSDVMDLLDLPESTIDRRIKTDLKGGRISYAAALIVNEHPRSDTAASSFMSWLYREKWWLVLPVLSAVATIVLGIPGPTQMGDGYVTLTGAVLLASVLSFVLGSTSQSRAILLLSLIFFFGIFLFLTMVVPVYY